VPAPLTSGNTAKLYCLRLIDDAAAQVDGDFRIVDLGCGDGRNFVELLRRRDNVRYVGVEPLPGAAEAARGLLPSAEIVVAPAAHVRLDPADAVVSFSVLEHVVDRPRYLAAVAAHLVAGGRAYLNYDTGHFVADASAGERVRALAGRMLAAVGNDSHYRAAVTSAEVEQLVADAGLRITDDKAFNTDVKRLYPRLPEDRRDAFMERWLEFELELSRLGTTWSDELASVFRTRNLVLQCAS
jgi:SAM-dependent methyltransferase